MAGIQGASTGINAVLDENRHALSQLSGVHMLLKKACEIAGSGVTVTQLLLFGYHTKMC
jgi:hypothetical protein